MNIYNISLLIIMLCFGSMIMCLQLEICKKFFFNFLLVMVERQTKWRLWGKEVDVIGKHFTSRLRTGKWIISYHSQHKMFSLKSDSNLSFPKCYARNLCDQKYLLNSASPVDFHAFSFPDVGRTFCACGLRSLACTSWYYHTVDFQNQNATQEKGSRSESWWKEGEEGRGRRCIHKHERSFWSVKTSRCWKEEENQSGSTLPVCKYSIGKLSYRILILGCQYTIHLFY